MALIYRKEESLKDSTAFDALLADPEVKKWWQQVIFFAVLAGILVFTASKNWIITSLPVLILGILLSFGVSRVSFWVNAINSSINWSTQERNR